MLFCLLCLPMVMVFGGMVLPVCSDAPEDVEIPVLRREVATCADGSHRTAYATGTRQ